MVVGYYATAAEAAHARDRVALCLCGRTATNFPPAAYALPECLLAALQLLCQLPTSLAVPLLKRAPDYALDAGVQVRGLCGRVDG